jgi:hypothetical protein
MVIYSAMKIKKGAFGSFDVMHFERLESLA